MEWGRLAPAVRDDHEAARAKNAFGLAEESRDVDLRDQIEGVVLERQVSGVGDSEGDTALRVEADPVLGTAHHLFREVDAADAGMGELARHQEGPDPGARAELEDALG